MLVIYVIFFILLYTRINKRLRISRFIVGYYLVSSIFSVYLFYFTDLHQGSTVTCESVLYFCGIYLLFIKGLIAIEKSFVPLSRYRLNEKTVVYFSYFLIVISLVSFYYSMGRLGNLQITSLGDVVSHRNEFVENAAFKEGFDKGVLGYLTGPANMLTGAKLFMFFYLITFYRNKHNKLAILLLICSLSYFVANLAVVGRDAMMQWLVLLILNYIIYSRYLDKSLKKKIRRAFYLFVPMLLIPTIYITIARFATNSEGGLLKGFVSTFDSIINYFGQGMINFSYMFDYAYNFDLYGKMTFPIFWGDEAFNHFQLNDMPYFRYAMMPLNVFHTFIGAFYMDFGFWGTIIISVLFYLFFKFIAKISSANLPSILLLLFTSEILLMGLFYFMHWMPMFQKIYMLTLFCCVVLKFRKDFAGIHILSKKHISIHGRLINHRL